MDPWWTAQQAGLLGGIAGGFGGLLGVFCGVAGGILVPRGIGKRTVLTTMAALALLGLVLLATGAFAAFAGQPDHVYAGMLVGGVVFYGVCSCLSPTLLARYHVADTMRAAGLAPDAREGRATEVLMLASEEIAHSPGLRRWRRRLFFADLAVAAPFLVWGVVLLANGDHGWRAPFTAFLLGSMLVVNALVVRFEHLTWSKTARWFGTRERRRLDAEELRRS